MNIKQVIHHFICKHGSGEYYVTLEERRELNKFEDALENFIKEVMERKEAGEK